MADLTRLPGLYEECARILGGADRQLVADRTTGGPMPGIPFNPAAAEARGKVLTGLSSWAALVADERGVTPPARAVADMVDFLIRHVSWLARHPAAAELTHEITELVGAAKNVIDPARRRRVRVGGCPRDSCDGELVAAVRPEASLLNAEIICSADASHRWCAHEWTELTRLMPALRGETANIGWYTVTDIGRLWRVPPGTIYRLASERRWRRKKAAGIAYYHGADVEQALSDRAR